MRAAAPPKRGERVLRRFTMSATDHAAVAGGMQTWCYFPTGRGEGRDELTRTSPPGHAGGDLFE